MPHLPFSVCETLGRANVCSSPRACVDWANPGLPSAMGNLAARRQSLAHDEEWNAPHRLCMLVLTPGSGLRALATRQSHWLRNDISVLLGDHCATSVVSLPSVLWEQQSHYHRARATLQKVKGYSNPAGGHLTFISQWNLTNCWYNCIEMQIMYACWGMHMYKINYAICFCDADIYI